MSSHYHDLVATGGSDARGGDGSPRPANGSSSNANFSPAIPAAVSVAIVIILSLVCWRCLVFFRRPQRGASIQLEHISTPRMYEVQVVPASGNSTEVEVDGWEGLQVSLPSSDILASSYVDSLCSSH